MSNTVNSSDIIETIQPEHGFTLGFDELWKYRELFYYFTWRDIKVKYKQTLLGFMWAVLQPLVMMIIFVFFFSKALKLPTNNIPAPIFYFSGLLLWNLFHSGLSSTGNSMVKSSHIIRKIYFPRLIIPISGILTALFDFFMSLIIFVILLLIYEFTTDIDVNYIKLLLYLPAAVLITVGITFGLGIFLSALNVQYRDFRFIIPFMLQFLLFVTPVIYPISAIDDMVWAQYLLALNPMTGAIQLTRAAFTNTPIDVTIMLISITSTIIWIGIGLYTFRKMEKWFADLV